MESAPGTDRGVSALPQVLSQSTAVAVRRTLLLLVAGSMLSFLNSQLFENATRMWPTVIVAVLVPLWSYFELRRNRINRAFVIFSWALFIFAIGLSFYVGGIQAPVLYALPLTIMVCAWVQGRWAAVTMSALSVGALCVLVIGQESNWWLPLVQRPPVHILITYCALIAMIGVTAVLVAEHLKELSEHDRNVSEDLKLQVAALAQSKKVLTERTVELELTVSRLQETREQLASSEAKATLSTLVASVSHELKTPIGNSVMTASTLADQAREFSATIESGNLKRSELSSFVAHLGEGTALMLRNMQRAEDLLLKFQQVAADQASEQRREFDLRKVVQGIIDTLKPSLRRHKHRLLVEIPDGIHMDSLPGPLGQVVINLVNNAFLHAFEGQSNGVLTISAQADGDEVILNFNDNGVGIPEENLAKLFEPFFSTKIGKGGTGLGMAIVENLVTKTLGGRIAVSSVVGKGTCFEIRLPCAMQAKLG